jgi:hypothetical protein
MDKYITGRSSVRQQFDFSLYSATTPPAMWGYFLQIHPNYIAILPMKLEKISEYTRRKK